MKQVNNIRRFDFGKVPVDPFWNTGDAKELRMHRIHAYPAKFPAFITTKALQFARENKLRVRYMADIFCGCGTTAFEARRNNIAFWGCDINPVATLIASVKSRKYQRCRLERYVANIVKHYRASANADYYRTASERLRYWYKCTQYNELSRLRNSILSGTADGAYRLFFLCCFSNILKPTSVWLTKSIKPQVDPRKDPAEVLETFLEQCRFAISANDEVDSLGSSVSSIVTGNFLGLAKPAKPVDLVVTSPPYVTSYQYADLHQLSSLWLGFASDYRELRDGSIGRSDPDYNFAREWKRLNHTGTRVVSRLLDQYRAKAKPIAKYFLDMQQVANKTFQILRNSGLALFVIGNTEYKGVRIDNAKHLTESLLDAGFATVSVAKRSISKKILTPYRDDQGKFSTNSDGHKVYSEEFIVVGQK